MSVTSTKILVKVGKSSKIKFRGAQAFRAVTLDEMSKLSRLNPDASIAIIENIKQSDEGKLKQFILEFEAANEGNHVFFYVADNDDITCGVADELARSIYLDIKSLYTAIKLNCGIIVDTDLDLSAELTNTGDDSDDIFNDSFGDVLEAISKTVPTFEIKLPTINSRDDLGGFDESIITKADMKPALTKSDRDSALDVKAEIVTVTVVDPELQARVNSADIEIAKLKDQIKAEFDKNKRLSLLVKAIENERDAFKKQLKLYSANEVMEEPIPLSQYQELLDKIKRLTEETTDTGTVSNSKLEEIQDALDTAIATRDNAVQQLESYKERLKESGARLSNVNEKLAASNKELNELRVKVDKLEAQVGESELVDVTEGLKAELESTRSDLNNARVEIGKLTTEAIQAREYADKVIKDKQFIEGELVRESAARLFLLDIINNSVNESQESELLLIERTKELERVYDTISRFEQADIESKERISSLEDELLALSDASTLIESLKNDNKILEGRVNDQQQTIQSLNASVSAGIKSRAELEVKVREADRRVEIAVQETVGNLEKAKMEIDELEGLVEALKADNKVLEGRIESQQQTITELNRSMSDDIQAKSNMEMQIKEADRQIESLKSDNDGLKERIESQQRVIDQLNTTMSETAKSKAALEIIVKETDRRIDTAVQKTKTELDRVKLEVDEWKTKYGLVNSQLKSREEQYKSIVNSIGLTESGASSLVENSKAIENVNNQLKNQVVSLKQNLDSVIRERDDAQNTVKSLEDTNKNMRDRLRVMSELINKTGVGTRGLAAKPIKYSGRAMIIPVFGSGSFGITTTAMSLAYKLSTQAKVLYIDLDLVSPKADAWFVTNPIIKNVPDADPNSTATTSLGLLVAKQFPYIIQNISSIIRRVESTKGGCIDYFSGLYAKFDLSKILTANYEALLNYCGNLYTYIIVDLGRLGSSEANDQLIKNFYDIAYRNVFVTTSNKFEIRTFSTKLKDAGITTCSNACWLINMCNTTKLDDNCKRMMPVASYSMMQFSPEMYGERMKFMNDMVTRDVMNVFTEYVTMRR